MQFSYEDTFGGRLRQFRLDRSIGLRRLAEALAMAPSNLSRIERGKLPPLTDPQLKVVTKFLELDSISFEELVNLAKAEAMARQLGEPLGGYIRKTGTLFPVMMRAAQGRGYTKEELERLIAIINKDEDQEGS